jgi:hypothetical protein
MATVNSFSISAAKALKTKTTSVTEGHADYNTDSGSTELRRCICMQLRFIIHNLITIKNTLELSVHDACI